MAHQNANITVRPYCKMSCMTLYYTLNCLVEV